MIDINLITNLAATFVGFFLTGVLIRAIYSPGWTVIVDIIAGSTDINSTPDSFYEKNKLFSLLFKCKTNQRIIAPCRMS